MPSDIMDQVVGVVADNGGADGWCSRAQIEALMSATTIDKREVDRALRIAVDRDVLERDGDAYRPVEE